MILSLAFVLPPTAVHADLVTYTLTGTIQNVVGYSGLYGGLDPGASLPVAKGDRIAWTVRYDRSTPTTNFPNTVALAQGITLQDSYYAPSGPLISRIVDQTNGYHVYTSPADSIPAGSYSPSGPFHTYSLLGLLNFQGNGGTEGRVGFIDFQQSTPRGAIPYYAAVDLTSNRLLASLNLANLPLDQVPFRFHDA